MLFVPSDIVINYQLHGQERKRYIMAYEFQILNPSKFYIKVYTGVKLEWVVFFSVRLHDLIVNLLIY